jgi:N-formylglutamate amidohydrolase
MSLIVHVPHASNFIPQAERAGLVVDDAELRRQQHALVDHRTNELFAPLNPAITIVTAPVSRLVVDVERFRDDRDEAAAKHGMGAVYTHGVNNVPLRSKLEASERERLLKTWYDPHHAKLNREVERLCTTGSGECILIDAHSYPLDPLPTELSNSGAQPEICIGAYRKWNSGIQATPNSRPEICIGTDIQWSRGIEIILLFHFKEAGYEVGLNTPYKGSLVPSVITSNPLTNTYAGFSTVMIEVRRDVYLDADTSLPGARFTHLQSTLNALYEYLLETS